MTCSICRLDSATRSAIDHALVAHVGSIAKIAQDFDVSYDAAWNHAHAHLSRELIASAQADAASRADDLLEEVAWQRREARALLMTAKTTQDVRGGVAALGILLRQVELLAKLRGELQTAQQVNLLFTSEGRQLIAVILTALTPWPEARLSVAEALGTLEAKAAP